MAADNPYEGTQDSESPTTSTPQISKPWKFFPMWWWAMLVVLVALTFAIRSFDQAGGQLSLAIVIVFSIFISCLRCLWRPQVGLVSRVLPIASFMAFMFFVFGCLRFDEMSGNMMPRRVSFRWQPAPDERLAKLETAAEPVGIDLTQSTPDDFPQFLGPERTGKVNVEIAGNWNEQPPELVWKKEVGAGHSGFAAVNGYAITMEQRGNDEIVSCYDITTGDVVWSQVNPTRHETVPGGVGPRSTPTVHEGLVYTMGATGILQCLDGSNGDPVWQANLQELIETTPEAEYNTIQWGRAASPLIDQGRLIVPLGLKANPETDEPGATLICFDAKTGQEIWRSGDYQISYASPTVTTLGGLRQIVQVCESHACGFNADTGEHLWEYPWPGDSAGNASCSPAIPVDDQHVLLAKGYAHGSALVKIEQEDNQWTASKVWHKRRMKTKFTTAIIHNGFIYGLDDTILGCLKLENGKQQWKRGRYGHGQVLLANSKLLIQAEDGDVVLAEPNPEAFTELARFPAIEGRTWNTPCLYGNLLLVRNSQEAACYRLP